MKASAWTASTALSALFALMALVGATSVQAQSVYRIVGPDGRVTFSDKPPAPSDKATKLDSSGRAGAVAGAELPFELRTVISRYPVTLYSGDGCDPCNNGRALLTNRGIPFTERTVTTPQDGEALQKLSGGTTLPILTVGGQNIKGFQPNEWAQYLDAAGYPSTSVLSANYRNPKPSPLAPVSKPVPAKAQEPTQPAPPPPEPANGPSNPAGIRF
jgi:glutaredoxin